MNKQFLLSEMDNYTDRDAYVSDLALSSIWGDAPDADVPEDRIAALAQLWDDAHSTVKELAAAHGLSVRKLAEFVGVSYRTAEKWSSGERKAPVYLTILIAEALRRTR